MTHQLSYAYLVLAMSCEIRSIVRNLGLVFESALSNQRCHCDGFETFSATKNVDPGISAETGVLCV
jgi:hypothetical protein